MTVCWPAGGVRRRLSCGLRNSAVDTVFYLSVLGAIVIRHWPELRARFWLLGVLLGLEVFRQIF